MHVLQIILYSLLACDFLCSGCYIKCWSHKTRGRDLRMRAKKSKTMDDFSSGDIVSGLAAGGGGYGNCRAISPVYSPRTTNQKTYVKYLEEPGTKIVLGVGAAGSGKTLFACHSAIQELRRGTITKIIITRPVVPVEEEEIGFLPGSLINKMDPWTRPIFDILLEFYAQKDIDAMLHGGVIEISPLAFMRGRTFKRAFIIADEMQNSSPNQMLMLATRLGDGSKMVITGDLKQSDRGSNNGLADLLRKLKAYELRTNNNALETNVLHNGGCISSSKGHEIKYVELESEDVQRSAIVSKILNIYGGEIVNIGPGAGSGSGSGSCDRVIETLNSPKQPNTNSSNIESGERIMEGISVNNDAALIPKHHISKIAQIHNRNR